MKLKNLTCRIVALSLAVDISLPGHAFGLRMTQSVQSGLEEEIAGSFGHKPVFSGMEESEERPLRVFKEAAKRGFSSPRNYSYRWLRLTDGTTVAIFLVGGEILANATGIFYHHGRQERDVHLTLISGGKVEPPVNVPAGNPHLLRRRATELTARMDLSLLNAPPIPVEALHDPSLRVLGQMLVRTFPDLPLDSNRLFFLWAEFNIYLQQASRQGFSAEDALLAKQRVESVLVFRGEETLRKLQGGLSSDPESVEGPHPASGKWLSDLVHGIAVAARDQGNLTLLKLAYRVAQSLPQKGEDVRAYVKSVAGVIQGYLNTLDESGAESPAGLEEGTLESRVEEMARRTSAGDPTVTPEEVEKLLHAYYQGRVRAAPNAFEAYLAQARATLANDPARFWEEGYEILQRVVNFKEIQPAGVTFFQALELLNQRSPEQALATLDLEKGLSQIKDEAARVRLLRQKVGLPSPHDLEREADLSWSVVSRLEQGKRGIGPYARRKLRDFFQERLGVSLTLSFEILRLPLEKSVNRFKTTDERFFFILHDLLGWSYAGLVRLANTLRTPPDPLVASDDFRTISFNSARPGKRRLLRNALEKGLTDELKHPVTLDGHLRVVTSSISDSLKALPNSEKRLAWLLEGVLIWSKNELLRRAHIVGHDVVEPPQSKSAQSLEKWRKIQHALEEGIAGRGEKLSLGVDLLPQSGLEEKTLEEQVEEMEERLAAGDSTVALAGVEKLLRAYYRNRVRLGPEAFAGYLEEAKQRYPENPRGVWEEVYPTLERAVSLGSVQPPQVIFVEAQLRLEQQVPAPIPPPAASVEPPPAPGDTSRLEDTPKVAPPATLPKPPQRLNLTKGRAIRAWKHRRDASFQPEGMRQLKDHLTPDGIEGYFQEHLEVATVSFPKRDFPYWEPRTIQMKKRDRREKIQEITSYLFPLQEYVLLRESPGVIRVVPQAVFEKETPVDLVDRFRLLLRSAVVGPDAEQALKELLVSFGEEASGAKKGVDVRVPKVTSGKVYLFPVSLPGGRQRLVLLAFPRRFWGQVVRLVPRLEEGEFLLEVYELGRPRLFRRLQWNENSHGFRMVERVRQERIREIPEVPLPPGQPQTDEQRGYTLTETNELTGIVPTDQKLLADLNQRGYLYRDAQGLIPGRLASLLANAFREIHRQEYPVSALQDFLGKKKADAQRLAQKARYPLVKRPGQERRLTRDAVLDLVLTRRIRAWVGQEVGGFIPWPPVGRELGVPFPLLQSWSGDPPWYNEVPLWVSFDKRRFITGRGLDGLKVAVDEANEKIRRKGKVILLDAVKKRYPTEKSAKLGNRYRAAFRAVQELEIGYEVIQDHPLAPVRTVLAVPEKKMTALFEETERPTRWTIRQIQPHAWYGIPSVAQAVSLNESTLSHYIGAGKIKAKRVLGQSWVSGKEVKRLFEGLSTAGLEEAPRAEARSIDILNLAQQAAAGSVRVAIGSSALDEVPGLRQVVKAFGRAGLEERFILLPEEGLPEAERTQRLIDLVTEAFAVPDLSIIAYAGLEDRAMQRFEGMVRMGGVPFQRRQPTLLRPLVRQILLDLGVPEATATDEAVGRFLWFAGLEELA